MNVRYMPEAQAFLDTTEAKDPLLTALLDEVLTEFEENPEQDRWRRRAFGQIVPRVWSFDVRGRNEDIMILWQLVLATPTSDETATPTSATEEHILVSYIGPRI